MRKNSPEARIVRQMESLIRSPRTKEEALHKAIVVNPSLLYQFGGNLLVTKPKFGANFVADFGCRSVAQGEYWTFVEIERATHRLFTRKGYPTAALSQAMEQLREWEGTLNSDVASPYFGAIASYVIVIGRLADLTADQRHRLKIINRTTLRTRVMTWETFIEPVRRGLTSQRPWSPPIISDQEFRERGREY